MAKVSALLSMGFRPFFILAALMAVLNPSIWIAHYLGHISLRLPTSVLFWHGHEMLFGFSGALIAGFILTASPNWTRSLPYQGRSLAFLVVLWTIERLSFFMPVTDGLAFFLMNTFFPALTVMLLLKLQNSPKHKYVFIPILLGITLAKLGYSGGHLFPDMGYERTGQQIGIGLVRFILLLMAGRLIPMFMRKKIEGLQVFVPVWLNPLALFPIGILALPFPANTPPSLLTIIYLWAIITGIIRQGMWLPHRAIKIPLLLVLQMGTGFVYVGLILELIGLYYPTISFSQIPMHMLMVGGLGVLGIGMMTRIALGNTGNPVKADKLIVFAYGCVGLGAILRVILPLLWPQGYATGLNLSVAFWAGGFFIFLIKFWKKLTGPRLVSPAAGV